MELRERKVSRPLASEHSFKTLLSKKKEQVLSKFFHMSFRSEFPSQRPIHLVQIAGESQAKLLSPQANYGNSLPELLPN